MKPRPLSEARDPVLRHSIDAMHRAARRAQEVARQTGTRLVRVTDDGRIVLVQPDDDPEDRRKREPARGNGHIWRTSMRNFVLFATHFVFILLSSLSAVAQSLGSTGLRVEDLRLGADIATVSMSLDTHHAVIDTVVTDSSTVLRVAPASFMDLDGFLALYFDSTDELAAITWTRADMRHYHWPSQSWRDFPFWSPDVTRGKYEEIKLRLTKRYGEPGIADMPPAEASRWLTRDFWIRLLFNEGELSYSAILGDPE